MGYTITRNNNIFTITKTGVNDIYVTVYTQTFCGSNQWDILIPEQHTSNTLVITLPNKDDLYRIVVIDKQGMTEKYDVAIYSEFLKSFVEDVNYVLCGCPCEECNDCNKKEKDYLSALIKLLSYNIINGGIYNQYLTATNNCVKCNVLDTNQCLLLHETMLGNGDNTLLMKQIIAYYYLVFYYTDLLLNNNSSIVTERYNFNNIIQCIKKLGIDYNCIKDNIFVETNPDCTGYTLDFTGVSEKTVISLEYTPCNDTAPILIRGDAYDDFTQQRIDFCITTGTQIIYENGTLLINNIENCI